MQKQQKKKQNKKEPETLREHLLELRRRFFFCVAVFILTFIPLAFMFSNEIIKYLTDIGSTAGFSFITTAPEELVVTKLAIGGRLALVIILPIIVYNIARYCVPNEKKIKSLVAVGIISGLFAAGAYAAKSIMLPFMFRFFLNQYRGTLEFISTTIGVGGYVRFCLLTCTIFGFILEMPAIFYYLAKLKILRASSLKKFFPLAFVISLIGSAIVTPSDVTSCLMVFIPTILLYILSIALVSRVNRFTDKRSS